jgi:hypothetical protein
LDFNINLDILDPLYWHSLKYFGHYFFGILFIIMSILFTVRFWEILDYTNRIEIKFWLSRYVADGWWRKGGLNVAISMLKACTCVFVASFLLFSIATQFSKKSIPESRIVGGVIALAFCAVCVVWILGLLFIRATEKLFERYVSQNVSYTSSLILKRLIKTKVEIGLVLVSLMYMPFLYSLLKSITGTS